MDRDRQIAREAAARDAALGRRAKAIAEGQLGPVLRRWVNADVTPMAALMRDVATAYLGGDVAAVARLLDTPTAELATGRERPLRPLMEWCLRGRSPGRGGEVTTFADDLCLAFMASTITRIAQDKCTLAAALATAADILRDTVQGQFISHIQGASAMQALRERQPERWRQKQSLSRICARLASQVRPELTRMEVEGTLPVNGAKAVVQVLDHKGEMRRLSLKVPDAVDWEVMSLVYREEADGATPESRSLWLGFAGMFLAAAQRVGGWFEVSEHRKGRKGHTRTSKLLVLSEAAHEAIRKDVDRWLGQGFYAEPMVVPPENGDYLTVKHRKVTGQRPPKGLLTKADATGAWAGAEVLATTPWTINPYALAVEPAAEDVPDERSAPSNKDLLGDKTDAAAIMRVAESRRLAMEPALYLPTTMDFRGRLYYRTPWVSPQSGDLGKSLLCFPLEGGPFGGRLLEGEAWADQQRALASHLASLYSGPQKLDKAPLLDRQAWMFEVISQVETYGLEEVLADLLVGADKPLQLRSAMRLAFSGQTDRIPIQLDGTCNGLQHLSALFRDEEAAPLVNLTASTTDTPPADLYMRVAGLAEPLYLASQEPWAVRMREAGVTIARKLTKGPVMVLPYGGTREAVRLNVRGAVIEQLRARGYALGTAGAGHKDQETEEGNTPWHYMEGDDATGSKGYGAFRGRYLEDHPGFNTDAGLLSGLIWDCIAPAIPKAMQAMRTLAAIAGFVGERGLSWRVPNVSGVGDALWVVQAKSKAERKQVSMRGFHLPDMVRRLTLMANLNEVDPKAHRTGIVANFIHSLDAAHLAATLVRFRAAGGGCVGSVHDALLVRPSEAALMGRVLRETFRDLHEADPLMQPVRLIAVDGGEDAHYSSWHELAGAAGVAFPERGTYRMAEVEQSAWFFS